MKPETKGGNGKNAFHAVGGSVLATWGLGLMLLALTAGASKQLFVLPVLLIPVVIAGVASAVRGKSVEKREDGSQAAVLAVAGSYLAFPVLGSNGYFITSLCAILLIATFNLRRAIGIVPLGPAMLFLALMSPKDAMPSLVSAFCFAAVLLTVYFGRKESSIAQTSMSLAATLYLVNAHSVTDPTSASIAVLAHIVAVYFLRRQRRNLGVEQSERRVFLDELIILASLVLLLKILTELEEAHRFIVVGVLFAFASMFHAAVGETLSKDEYQKLGRGFIAAVTWNRKHREATTLAAMSVALVFAIRADALEMHPVILHTAKALAICALGLLLYRSSIRSGSLAQGDTAKLILAYAVVFAYPRADLIKMAALSGVVLMAFAQYYSIASAVVVSNRDLKVPAQGAWQSVFSGRALAQIRRTRSRVFEVVSQAPLIGWMFGLGDKAANGLREAFGGRTHWTISNYVIIFCILFGQFATMPLIFDLLAVRLPEAGFNFLGQVEKPEDEKLRSSLSTIVSVVIYSAAVFGVGARLSLPFITYMATVLAGFMLAMNWFGALDSKNPTSGFFYPMGFVCFMALARLMSRAASPKTLVDHLRKGDA